MSIVDMGSDQVARIIRDKVAGTSSKTEKESLLKANLIFPTFKRSIVAALDPFVTYGIAKLPTPDEGMAPGGNTFADAPIWDVLDMLATRKLTGNDARDEVKKWLTFLTPDSGWLFGQILLKDLRAGFSESTVNKADPGTVPTFDCMLAHKFSEHKHKLTYPLIAEPKLDGVRALTFVSLDSQQVNFYSRSGKAFTTFEHLKAPVLKLVGDAYWAHLESGGKGAEALKKIVFDSEVVSGQFNKTVGDVRRSSGQAVDAKLFIFDMLPWETFSKEDKKGCTVAGKYTERRARLERLMAHAVQGGPIKMLPKFVVEDEDEIHELYSKMLATGLEGLIIKDPNGLYHRRRNHAWTKIKAEDSVDVVVVDAIEGTGKFVGSLGALVVEYEGKRVNVGSGLTDEQRESFWNNEPFIGRMIEVKFHEVTPDGSLRHPRFVRFRDDKHAA